MESIKDLYIVGPGPSSSHTIGPYKAALDFKKDLNKDAKIVVTLFGSLALTGKGHLTDQIILKALSDYDCKIEFNYNLTGLKHPNTMCFKAFINNEVIKEQTYYSVGGGKIVTNLSNDNLKQIYSFENFKEIKEYCEANKMDLVQFVDKFEDKDLNDYLGNAVDKMFLNLERNLEKEGVLQGKLHTKRVAKTIFTNANKLDDQQEKYIMLVTSFAYSCLEGNADGDMVVTAPTCGSCGIVPSILYYEYKYNHIEKAKIINALKVAGIFGNICKMNASISGAVLGCQAEVGVASSMASAALSYIKGLSTYQIEYASEVSLEHFLGLTCDPVEGYVQIPCIERNGIGALRAYASYLYAKNIAPFRRNKVSFDDVVLAMKMTGDSLNSDYKETSEGGLAKVIK